MSDESAAVIALDAACASCLLDKAEAGLTAVLICRGGLTAVLICRGFSSAELERPPRCDRHAERAAVVWVYAVVENQ